MPSVRSWNSTTETHLASIIKHKVNYFFTFVVIRPPVLTKVWPKTLSYRNIPFRLYCPALRKSCVQFSFSGNILEATGTKWWLGQVPYIHDFLIMQSIYFVFGCGILISSVQYIVFHHHIITRSDQIHSRILIVWKILTGT